MRYATPLIDICCLSDNVLSARTQDGCHFASPTVSDILPSATSCEDAGRLSYRIIEDPKCITTCIWYSYARTQGTCHIASLIMSDACAFASYFLMRGHRTSAISHHDPRLSAYSIRVRGRREPVTSHHWQYSRAIVLQNCQHARVMGG